MARALSNARGARLRLRPEQRAIGFLFQGGGLWPHLTVARTLDFVLKCRGIAKAERRRRAAELLAWVEQGWITGAGKLQGKP